MNGSPLHRQSVVGQVYERLRSAILSGEIPPGDRIVELHVAKKLGTSRAPVREAVNRLLQAGLVETRANHGPSVVQMTHDQVAKLYKLRSVLECAVLDEVVPQHESKRVRSGVQAMRREIGRMQALAGKSGDPAFQEFIASDLAFHEELWAMSENEYIRHVLALISDQVRIALSIEGSRYGDLDQMAGGHVVIVDAIADGDLPRAKSSMVRHLAYKVAG